MYVVNPTSHKKLSKDKTSRVERQTTEIKKHTMIPDEEKSKLLPSGSKPLILYGLSKIHKPDVPFPPVVSTCVSATYNLQVYRQSSSVIYRNIKQLCEGFRTLNNIL